MLHVGVFIGLNLNLKPKISMRKLLILSTIGYFMAFMATLGTSCKHATLIDDDGVSPIDTMPIDTMNPIDTTPNGTPCDPDVVYFETQVLPILVSNCAMAGCHNAASHQDGVILDNYQNVMQTAEIKPFDLGDSKLYEAITESDLEDRMPPTPNAALSQDQIQVIANWISQGAQNLTCDANAGGCDTTSVSFSQDLQPIVNTYCKGCHSGGSPSGGLDLSTYNGVKAVALNGKLYGAISWATGYQKMPQGGNKLDDCTIAKFNAWINAGAPQN